MSNCKVIALANQKGGVGKTTTTMNLGIGLANLGNRVLLIDSDPQANLTMALGYTHPDVHGNNICGVLRNEINDSDYNCEEYIVSTEEGVDLVPSSIELSGMEVQLASAMSREMLMKGFIEKIRDSYDYVLIDCQPSLGVLTVNSLVCSDSVIIPTQAAYFSAMGLGMLRNTVTRVRKTLNPSLKIEGVLMTMVNARTNITKETIEEIIDSYGKTMPIFSTQIPYSVKSVEAATCGESIYKHSKDSKIADAYEQFVKEVDELGKRQKWQDRTECLR